MTTTLHPSPIYGPVKSRRLGISLGINLMPEDGKICSFDCIYCECGFNSQRRTRSKYPEAQSICRALEKKLEEMRQKEEVPDVLTFAGNGEPTGHPQFKQIIEEVILLRNKYCPNAHISVLSNATFIHRQDVFEALMKVDYNILKLDTTNEEYIRYVDRPNAPTYNIEGTISRMKDFHGHIIIQTLFMKGEYNGTDINNTTKKHVSPWIKALKEIQPQSVMIYTIDRETPAEGLRKASPKELDAIRNAVANEGISCTVSY